MHVSLLERCYQLLNREAPMASDLRFLVSVVRILSEFERVGDLALRVLKLAPQVDEPVDQRCPVGHRPHAGRPGGRAVPHRAAGLVDAGPRRWPASWPSSARRLETYPRAAVGRAAAPRRPRRRRRSPWALFVAGQAADRIADHAAIIGARLRYLITGEPAHLAAEVR